MSNIILQNTTVVFLKRASKYLLMKRGKDRKISPNVWSGVGGKLEPNEINDPYAACLREIAEETGITSNHVFNLQLKYIIIRRYKDTIRQSYVYFGETDTENVVDTDEGRLHWIPEDELLNREYTKTYDAMLKHYMNNQQVKGIIVGVAENYNGKLKMSWSIAEDFE